MKIFILAVTTLNFVVYFPFNRSQEIHSQKKQRFSANPPLYNHTASNPSSALETEENSPTEDSNSYSAPLDGIAKIIGSPSEGNHLQMLQADLYNFPASGNDGLHSLFTNRESVGFAYAKRTVDNPTEEDPPKRKASPSSDTIQEEFADSSFADCLQIKQRRRRVPLIHYGSNLELFDTPVIDRDSEISPSHEHFPSISKTEALFASDPATYMQNFREKFTSLEDEGTADTSNENIFLGTGTTTTEEAEQGGVFFMDSRGPIEKGTVTPRKHFGSLIDREMSSEEESTFYTKVDSEPEEDVFQETEDIPSSHNFKHFDLENGGFEMDGFLDSNTENYLSLYMILTSTEITITDIDLIVPEEENVYDLFVTSPSNKKIHFKPMAPKPKINSLDVSASIEENVKTEGGVAVPTPSNSMHQIERMGYSRPLNTYYDIISKPVIGAINDSYVTWETIKNKQLSSTNDNKDFIYLRIGYRTPTDINAKKVDRPPNERKTVRNEVINSFHIDTGVVNSNSNKAVTADSPIKKYIIKISTLKRKPNYLGSASRDNPKLHRDEETTLIADSNGPFSLAQATNPVKTLDWAAVMAHKTYSPNEFTTTVPNVGKNVASHDAENTLYSRRYDSETSFEEHATLNYEADLQNEESMKSEEEDTLEKENTKDYIYVIPMEDDYILKEDSLATTHYSTNPEIFRETTKPRDGQLRFENPKNMVSKPLHVQLNPKVQRKMIATNTNSNSNHGKLFSDTIYKMIRENIQNAYPFAPETMPKFMRRNSNTPLKGYINPGEALKDISKTNSMASLNLVNVTRMPTKDTIISPYTSALESKTGNDNSNPTAPTRENIQPIGLKSLLIPSQKISRYAVPLGGNDLLSDTTLMSEVSQPTEEHVTSIDHNWEVIDEPSAANPFTHVSPVPLEDPVSFPEKIINVVDLHTTDNGDISDDTDSLTLSPNIAPQTAAHRKRGMNKDTEFESHNVQLKAISSPAEERDTSQNEAKTPLSNDKTDVEEKFYFWGDNIPVNLEKLKTMRATELLSMPVVAYVQQKGLENSRKLFYPGSTVSTTKLTQVQPRDPLPLEILDQLSTKHDIKFNHLPIKMTFSPAGFIKSSNPKLDPEIITGKKTTKLTDDSFIPDDILTVSDSEVPSADDIAFIEDRNNILDGGRPVASIEKNYITQDGIIPFMEGSSAESHMEIQVGDNKVNNADLTTTDLDESTVEFLSNDNTFYAGEQERSPTIRKPTVITSNFYTGIGSPVPFPSTSVTENPSEENLVESKSERKYKVWFLRGTTSDPGNNDMLVQALPALFYKKPSRYVTTHFLTDQNEKFSDGLSLNGGSASRSEREDSENIHSFESESVKAMGEIRSLPSKITGPTLKSTKVTGRKQFPTKGLSSTAFNVLLEARSTMSSKSEDNKNEVLRAESYNSDDTTLTSFPASLKPDSEIPFPYKDSEERVPKDSSSSSHIKKINSATAITHFSSEESDEWSSSAMPPDENTRFEDSPLVLTTENTNLISEDLSKHSVLMCDIPLTNFSEIASVPAHIEYIDVIEEPHNQDSQVIGLPTGLNPLNLNASFPHKTSANVIRNWMNNDAESPSTNGRENIMSGMSHSQDSNIPLDEFGVISNDEFSFTDNSEDLNNMATLPFSSMNVMHTIEDPIIPAIDSSYEVESVLPREDDDRFKGSLALERSVKREKITDTSSDYLETSGPLPSDLMTNIPAAWSDMFETNTDYINFINEETVLTADSNVPLNLPQAKNPVKKLSWATIMKHKICPPSESSKAASEVGITAASHDAENTLYTARYESETSFEEDATLNYEADLQNEESMKSEKEDTLEKENIKDYIYVIPMEDDYIPKEDSLATAHYSTNPDAYDTTSFRWTTKPRPGQLRFKNPENVISKPLLGQLNAEVQRKMIATNTNSNSNHGKLFSDIIYKMIRENIQNSYPFAPETMPKFMRRNSSTPLKGYINPSEAIKYISNTNSTDSLNLVNVTRRPTKDNIISPYTSALEPKTGNDNSSPTAPSRENIQAIGLKSLLIPSQNISRYAVPLGGNDLLSDTTLMSEVSQPTEEHVTSIDHNWEVIDEPSAANPFTHVSPVPLEDPVSFPEKIINVVDLHTTDNGDISDDTDSLTLSPNITPQTAAHRKRGMNKDTEFESHNVQLKAISSPAEERDTSQNEAKTPLSNDKTDVEEKFYFWGDNIPVNLEKLKTMRATELLSMPVVAYVQQKGLENSRKLFYPGSTVSTTKLTQVQPRDPLPLEILDQLSTKHDIKFNLLPMKMVLSPDGFIENRHSNPLTSGSIIFIPEDIIKNFDIIGDKPLIYSSEQEPEVSDIIEFMHLLNEPDRQDSHVIRLPTGLNPLSLNASFPHKTSANVIRNWKNNNRASSSTMERENIISGMSHSQDSHIPLAEFGVISNDEFSSTDDSEDLSDMATLHFSPRNTKHTIEDANFLDTDSSYEIVSVLPGEDDDRLKGSLALDCSAKYGVINDASNDYLETSGQLPNDFLTNTPAAWSDMFETNTDYINFNNEETALIVVSNVPFNLP